MRLIALFALISLALGSTDNPRFPSVRQNYAGIDNGMLKAKEKGHAGRDMKALNVHVVPNMMPMPPPPMAMPPMPQPQPERLLPAPMPQPQPQL